MGKTVTYNFTIPKYQQSRHVQMSQMFPVKGRGKLEPSTLIGEKIPHVGGIP